MENWEPGNVSFGVSRLRYIFTSPEVKLQKCTHMYMHKLYTRHSYEIKYRKHFLGAWIHSKDISALMVKEMSVGIQYISIFADLGHSPCPRGVLVPLDTSLLSRMKDQHKWWCAFSFDPSPAWHSLPLIRCQSLSHAPCTVPFFARPHRGSSEVLAVIWVGWLAFTSPQCPRYGAEGHKSHSNCHLNVVSWGSLGWGLDGAAHWVHSFFLLYCRFYQLTDLYLGQLHKASFLF